MYVYTILVCAGEAEVLCGQLYRDLVLPHATWVLEPDSFTGEIFIRICSVAPLTLEERRKIVSCGLQVNFVGE